jgi:hypothetical protein
VFRNRIKIFFEKEIARVQKEYSFFTLPQLLDPFSSSGQTASPAFFPSGGAGVNLTINIIAIEENKSLWRFLGMGWKCAEEKDTSQNQNAYHKPLSFHRSHPLHKNIYTPFIPRKQGATNPPINRQSNDFL